MARHTDTLTFYDLASAIAKLLKSDGRFYVHFPVAFAASFLAVANKEGLAINERILVRHGPDDKPIRVILRGGFGKSAVEEDGLTLRNVDDSDYSPRVRAMLSPYYASLT